ncbi:hypothetical protein [Streptomyces malaysiensis]|uniref:Uncharacterized protein n=1 Tax=Streptomyces malaysiensis subsp. samsunensis TaxID=459658 RepID=A0A9X2M6H2_STRMQ|nr:hypothetical protein [Streptomyces samsunensis]MCQ8836392.1 hypothetical protein [Streptomyces samsunensis]
MSTEWSIRPATTTLAVEPDGVVDLPVGLALAAHRDAGAPGGGQARDLALDEVVERPFMPAPVRDQAGVVTR